ncbi:conserved hypothetical protein [Chloroherpeton thalassium ATCC 35110]|uniref:Uncharacterized protein n=1 Tax=Chloroherpeton thalassium (strain ATCC 35110 / GB-78) TaxID=517418 RepID=B3QSS9_CHLT3|nr:hypothetical protein [Chloroherpeton thalassium]ACF14126.1 conserved hypothetical protein [Chloroherpeton thalassium ATCC 35110]
MHWGFLFAFALPIFFILVFIFYKFVSFKLENENLTIEPLSEMVSDNPVGLSQDELEKMKRNQKEAQKHLEEVISKVPVEMVNGRFVARPDKLKDALATGKKNEHVNGSTSKTDSENN